MAKLKNVEKKIWEIEGFDVRFTHKGKDVRGDKKESLNGKGRITLVMI